MPMHVLRLRHRTTLHPLQSTAVALSFNQRTTSLSSDMLSPEQYSGIDGLLGSGILVLAFYLQSSQLRSSQQTDGGATEWNGGSLFPPAPFRSSYAGTKASGRSTKVRFGRNLHLSEPGRRLSGAASRPCRQDAPSFARGSIDPLGTLRSFGAVVAGGAG